MKKILSSVLTVTLLIGIILGMTGCGSSAGDKEESPSNNVSASSKTDTGELEKATVYVFAAASLTNAMNEIQELYKKVQPNVTLVFNTDSSGTLQTQIEQGAECDIFFSAATKQMNNLDKGGLMESSSIVNLLQNKVVLIKSKGGTTSVNSFETIPSAKNIALAGESVPVGAYAREIFKNLNIYDQVMAMEINEGANVSAVLAAVFEKSNEIGVVYSTDAASVKDKVDIIASAPEGSLATPVIYPVGMVKNKQADEAEKAAAKDFLSYLQTPEAVNVFVNYGFDKAAK